MADSVEGQVHQKLASAAQGHVWLESILAGQMPTPPDEIAAINGLIALSGGIMAALELLAKEIDGLKGH